MDIPTVLSHDVKVSIGPTLEALGSQQPFNLQTFTIFTTVG